jgi:hypothetical protein
VLLQDAKYRASVIPELCTETADKHTPAYRFKL